MGYEFNGQCTNSMGTHVTMDKATTGILSQRCLTNQQVWIQWCGWLTVMDRDGPDIQTQSQHELRVAASGWSRERERERDERNEGGWWKYASCNKWPGDVASAYAVITKNRRNTVTIIGYHGMSQRCDSNKNSKQPTAVHAQNIYKSETTTSPLHPRFIRKK